jgi:hypothetical protein
LKTIGRYAEDKRANAGVGSLVKRAKFVAKDIERVK